MPALTRSDLAPWIDPAESDRLTATDREVAERLGLTKRQVAYARQQAGLHPCRRGATGGPVTNWVARIPSADARALRLLPEGEGLRRLRAWLAAPRPGRTLWWWAERVAERAQQHAEEAHAARLCDLRRRRRPEGLEAWVPSTDKALGRLDPTARAELDVRAERCCCSAAALAVEVMLEGA